MVPNPAVWWKFDAGVGTVIKDYAPGNANPATLTNGSWISPGKFDGAINNASSSHAATFIGINMDKVYTIGFWIRGWDGSDDGIALGGGTGTYAAYIDATDIYHSAASNFVSVPHGGGMSDGAWHHLAIVRENANIQFYKDGSPLGALQVSAGLATAGNLALSAILGYENGTFPLLADIDDVRMYYAAFTADQIAELYADVPASRAYVNNPTVAVSFNAVRPVYQSVSVRPRHGAHQLQDGEHDHEPLPPPAAPSFPGLFLSL